MSDTSLIFNLIAKDKVSSVLGSMSGSAAAAGVAIGAALTAGLATAMQKSKSDALLSAQLGAGPQMAAKLGEISGDLYSRGVVDSIETGNAAIKGAIQNALVPPDASSKAIEDVAAKITNLGAIMEEDADRVSSAVSQMLRTGMAESAEQAFDLLQAGVEKGLNKSQDLLDTFNEYGTQFRSIGLSGPQAMGLISQAVQAGARDSDVAADAIKEFAIEAVAGGERVRGGFESLGLSADQMVAKFAAGGPSAAQAFGTVLDRLRAIEDPAKRNAVAIELFGTKAEDLGGALGAMNLSTASSSLGNLSGAAQRAGQTLEQSAGAKVEALRRSLEMGLVNALSSTATWVEKNSGLVQGLAIVLGPIAAIIAIIVIATKVWTAVQMALNVAMMANPIGLIILAIIALVAIFVLAWNHSETFRNIVTGAWQYIWDKIKAAGSWITGTLWPWIKRVWSNIGSGVVSLKNTIVSTWHTVIGFFRSIPGRLSSIGSSMWNGIKNGFRAAINYIIGAWNGISFGIPRIDIPGIGSVGGGTFAVPQIPYLARGGVVDRSGVAVVGELGPEIVSLPRGASVSPLPRGGGELTVRLEASGAENEMLRLLRKLVRVHGGGNVQTAFGR
ncbi:phage tail tape measure protein [Nonomuraea rubra]